ncbi:tyrosine-type recombinase/integrase [Lentisphaerota bacterium WC36G]|nr:site-specific integrase [Lentisphaerae bacterium WC36]UDQ98899.1 site-specific integrase [Lentisphaerae bacterium WC36]
MGKLSIRMSFGTVYQKKVRGIFYYRYQLEGLRKTVSLQTSKKAEAIKKAEELIPIVRATSQKVIAAHVKVARGMNKVQKQLSLQEAWYIYSVHPERATPATINENLQYKSTFNEFIKHLDNKALTIRDITLETADKYSQHLKTTGIAVDTHNRKIKRLRRIFKTLHEYRDAQNPFDSPILFRREREEHNLGIRRLAFTREQEQQIFNVLDDDKFKVINKSEVRLIYYLGMYTGQRLKDCVLLKWRSVDLNKRRIWVKQFKTGKEVTIPIADILLNALYEAKSWNSAEYVCLKMAERYNTVNELGKNIGNNLVNVDVMRVIKWTGLETAVAVKNRKRKVTQYGFHSLRHTFASHCAEAGVPKAVLLSILGTDSDIADKYYTHIGEESQIKAINVVANRTLNSPQDSTTPDAQKIANAIDYLQTLPPSPETQHLISLLS